MELGREGTLPDLKEVPETPRRALLQWAAGSWGGGECSLPLVVKRLVLNYGCLGRVGSLRTGAGSFSSLCPGVAQSLRQGQFWLERWPSYPLETPLPHGGQATPGPQWLVVQPDFNPQLHWPGSRESGPFREKSGLPGSGSPGPRCLMLTGTQRGLNE